MCKIILLTGTIVGYAYIMEFFVAWYSGNPYEVWAFLRGRVAGPVTDFVHYIHPAFPLLPHAPYWWAYYFMMSFNVLSPQFFWFKFCRRNLIAVMCVCMCVNAGMWFERFVIIVTSIHRDFLPSSWGVFHPTWVDIWTFVGTFGLFMTLFLLFIRVLPMIAIAEGQGRDAHGRPAHRPRWVLRLRRRRAARTDAPAARARGRPGPHRERHAPAPVDGGHASSSDERPSRRAHRAEPERADQVNFQSPRTIHGYYHRADHPDAKFTAWPPSCRPPPTCSTRRNKSATPGSSVGTCSRPFPIHGMDDAMGLGKSAVSYIVLAGGLTGMATALLVELGSALYLYPLVVQGKPTNIFTIPAFFPVIFELTILFSAFGAVFGMLALNLLPRWNHPLFNWDRFNAATNDAFFVVVEATDGRFSEKATQELLTKVGGANVTLIYDEE